jgi:hypothetical protein
MSQAGAEPMMSLYFAEPNRRYALERIDVYAKEVADRVLPIFDHMEQEADEAANQHYRKTGNPEDAHQRGISIYIDLNFVRTQVTGLAIAGIFHLWERLLKEFLVQESHHYTEPTRERILGAQFPKLVKWLEEIGWSIKSAQFYDSLDCLRLVANVIKHGDGQSCRSLLKKAPNMFISFGHPWADDKRGASHLSLKREDFPEFASAARMFFEQFPARLPPQ